MLVQRLTLDQAKCAEQACWQWHPASKTWSDEVIPYRAGSVGLVHLIRLSDADLRVQRISTAPRTGVVVQVMANEGGVGLRPGKCVSIDALHGSSWEWENGDLNSSLVGLLQLALSLWYRGSKAYEQVKVDGLESLHAQALVCVEVRDAAGAVVAQFCMTAEVALDKLQDHSEAVDLRRQGVLVVPETWLVGPEQRGGRELPFVFKDVREPSSEITLEVWDSDVGGWLTNDDFLGQVSFPLYSLQNTAGQGKDLTCVYSLSGRALAECVDHCGHPGPDCDAPPHALHSMEAPCNVCLGKAPQLCVSLKWSWHESDEIGEQESSVAARLMGSLMGAEDCSDPQEMQQLPLEELEDIYGDDAAPSIQRDESCMPAWVTDDNNTFRPVRGDYLLQVHVIEARELRPKEVKTGTCDPVVRVEAFGESKHTVVRRQQLHPVWDSLLSFNIRDVDEQMLSQQTITISVLDASSGVVRRRMVGLHTLDSLSVYYQPDHELLKTWLGLLDPQAANNGLQGYLRVSISILGPGDQPKLHGGVSAGSRGLNEHARGKIGEVQPGFERQLEDYLFSQHRHTQQQKRQGEKNQGGGFSGAAGALLLPPQLKQETLFLVVSLHRADIMLLRGGFASKGMLEVYVSVEFAGNTVRSKAIASSHPSW